MANILERGIENLKTAVQSEFNPYLTGNFAPVHDELVVHDLKVIGEIPKDLTGIYMRNGPNPQFIPLPFIWPFDGDGMIHAVYLADGKASYRNRYVETKDLLMERRAGKGLFRSLTRPTKLDPKWAEPGEENLRRVKNAAKICIIRHAGRYLATDESAPSYEMTNDLQTIGPWDPYRSGRPIHVSPHTRLDPLTGDLWFVNWEITPPYLTVYRVDGKGQVANKWDIDKRYPTMIHDFVLTKNYVIVFDCPAVFNSEKRLQGKLGLEWRPELGLHIGVMPRTGGPMKWHRTDPFFVFHFANAYEKDDVIVVDYVHYPSAVGLSGEAGAEELESTLYRTTIDTTTGRIENVKVDDRILEFPRIKEDRDTLQHRFVYSPSRTPMLSSKAYHALLKYDMERHMPDVHEFGHDAQIDEAVFAPSKKSSSEDDGYLMLFVFNNALNQSEFVILDARNMGDQPLARVQLPRRVPHGLHGMWMSGPWQD
jgi:carotenoid cleavage dioxygenase